MAPGKIDGVPTIASYFAACAYLEAASVIAFRAMARELAAHGAPPSLIAACKHAAMDEVRHARLTARLARRYGANVIWPRIAPGCPRTLVDMAIENVVEGVVRETYGAASALVRAQSAARSEIREIAHAIARDECGHAELSWKIAAWLDSQLSREDRARVAACGHAAIAELRHELAIEPACDVHTVAGVPTSKTATRIHAELVSCIWANSDVLRATS
ncbi:ferritin-like domain-containing protein [Pendulispora rubella]|uniref:Ferritin-like domain-containing protein n=1 Tax=Pendulispora rubella TaxID=2741070 RepID=A0ABZ2L1H4_9BACT